MRNYSRLAGSVHFSMLTSQICPTASSGRPMRVAGPRGAGNVCLNGPPARHFQPGDKIIMLAEAWVDPTEMQDLDPVVVFVDDQNRITEIKRHRDIAQSDREMATFPHSPRAG